MAWNGRSGKIRSSLPNCTRNAFPSIARRVWSLKPRASSWPLFASRSKVHCNLEESPKTRGRIYPEWMSQVSEQESHSEVEVVLSAAHFHSGVHDGAYLVLCGVGRSRAKGEGKRARGEASRLRRLRSVPEWPSCRNRDVFDLSDEQR